MTPDQFRKVKELFLAAGEKPPEERVRFLDEACREQPDLRRRVEAMLVEDDDANGGSGERAGEVETKSAGPDARADERERIGPYKVLEVLGEGGMGIVYLAEQREPVHRRVALKLIKFGMDSKEVVARFEAERQALAMLGHPNIASVFEAGTTADGRPYFAMEAVPGLPITDYCDRHKLGITARLSLFLQVCRGIDHAHKHNIIHRDIKPTNVLVTAADGEPVAKIIDFGVARATNQRLTEKTVYTQQGCIIGTPAYMSPEQAEMSGEGVDRRADVYSLGVLLYEILVAHSPLEFDVQRFALDEVIRRIREEEPVPPSVRWNRLNLEHRARLAILRGTQPAGLEAMFRRDLDWICLKALEKERDRRYASAGELSDDIQRHLRNEPVVARAPSVIYRVGKFVRKNRGPVIAVAAVILTLTAGLVSSLLLYAEQKAAGRRLEAKNAEADDVLTFLQNTLAIASPSRLGKDATVLEALERARRQVESRFAEHPEARAKVQVMLGKIYSEFQRLDDARALFEAALETRRGLPSPDADVAEVLILLADVATVGSEYQRADDLLAAAARSLDGATGDVGAARAAIACAQGYLYSRWRGYGTETLRSLRDSVALARAHAPELLGDSLNNLAVALKQSGQFDEAERLYRESIAIGRAAGDRANVATRLHNLALLIRKKGADLEPSERRSHLRESERLERQALEVQSELLGDKHFLVASTMNNLAVVLADLGRLEEAASNDKGAEDNFAAAEKLLRGALAINLETFGGKPDMETIDSRWKLAAFLRSRDRTSDEAEEQLRAALAEAEVVWKDEDSTWLAGLRSYLAGLLLRRGDHEEAEALFRASIAMRKRLDNTYAGTWLDYAQLLTGRGRFAEAEVQLLDAWKIVESEPPGSAARTRALKGFVEMYDAWGKPEKAAEYRRLLSDDEARAAGASS